MITSFPFSSVVGVLSGATGAIFPPSPPALPLFEGTTLLVFVLVLVLVSPSITFSTIILFATSFAITFSAAPDWLLPLIKATVPAMAPTTSNVESTDIIATFLLL